MKEANSRLGFFAGTLALSAALAAAGGCGGGGGSDTAAPVVTLQRAFPLLAFRQPLALVHAAGDPARWYAVEKAGRILVFPDESGASARVFADLSGRVESAPSEAGLLGIAFHPQFAANGFVFLSYTAPGTGPNVPLVSKISRFVSPDRGATLDPASEQVILSQDQPFENHNGGGIAFGPDGFLYIGFGDGGSAGDPLGNAQNLSAFLGKFLRIDIDGAAPYAIPPGNPLAAGGGRPELWAWGLRNPWRWSFDRATGALWAGDVGQNQWEEVDRIVAGGNYGWSVREGAHCFRAAECSTAGLTDPVAEYSHAEGISVTGGYVYRGNSIPGLVGHYVYADFGSGRVWAFPVEAAAPSPRLLMDTGLSISSFGEADNGDLFAVDFAGGGIHRLTAAPP